MSTKNKNKFSEEMSERMEETAPCTNEKLMKRKYKEDVDEQTVVEPSQEVKKPPMPTYGKYNVLKVLKENHCLITDEEQLTSVFARNKRFNLEDIKKFINKSARKSQSITEKNNKSIEFKRATDLIKSIEERRPLTDQTLDIPLSLKTITDVFDYGEAEEVDVRMLYQTLTNLSLGFPTSNMDSATSGFLYGVYKDFIGQVNTPQFREDVRQYQKFFDKNGNVADERADVKHPTGDSDMQLVIKSTLNSPSMNPLNIPYSLVHKPKDSF